MVVDVRNAIDVFSQTSWTSKLRACDLNVSLPIELAQAPTTPARYRPDIDGLRAIAIIAVVAYHGFPERIHGGFVGVDIFFVISGYLITGVIFSHMLAGNFSILEFYQRRIRRIFPALILVAFVVFVVGWFVLAPREFESLGSNIAGGALFVQNFVLLGQVGYFDIEAAKKPLLHLWSLGIEEQYYIAWPLLLLLFQHKRWNVIVLTVAFIVVSFCLGVALFQKNPDLAFYLPVTRAWELLIGSLISIFLLSKRDNPPVQWLDGQFNLWAARAENGLQRLARMLGAPQRENLLQETFALLALVAITFVIFRHKPHTPYPGSAAVLSVMGTAILILTPAALINRFFLSSRLTVFIGLISYPLYLWHFPLMAYARIRSEEAVSPGTMAGLIILSFVLAWLTYEFVERPIRYGKHFDGVKITGLIAGMTAVGTLGLAVTVTEGFPIRIPEAVRGFMLTGKETAPFWRRGRCLMLPEQGAADFAEECSGTGQRPILFLWGDSYAAALYPGLEYYSGARGYSVSQYTASACPPLIGYVYSERPFCKPINDFVLTKIAEQRPDVVILHSTWVTFSLSESDLDKGLRATVSELKGLNIKNIVLLGPPASWLGDGLAADVLDYYYQHSFRLIPERTNYRSNDVWTRPADAWLQNRANELGITYISARSIMCNEDGCLARIGDDGAELMAFDNGHLTRPGSIFMAQSILDRLLEKK